MEFQELLAEQDRLRQLEDFLKQHGQKFRGRESADYETAQQVREQVEALENMARALAEGRFDEITPEQLRELLSEHGAQSLILLRNLERDLRDAGLVRQGEQGLELTPRAIRRIGAQALAAVYSQLRKSRPGSHDTVHHGVATRRPDETRPWQYGDAMDLHVVRTLLNAVQRRAAKGESTAAPLGLERDDLEVFECDFSTQTTTVLLLDMSWSMSWEGRFAAAKKVALAMHTLMRSRYPRDYFAVVGFYTRAVELDVADLPEVTWNMGDPFTNLQDGLRLGSELLGRQSGANKNLIVVTDGQPTAYYAKGRLYCEWPMTLGGLSTRATVETLREVERVTRRGIRINTFMLDDSPPLRAFVDKMTAINRGRAFFTSPSELGHFLLVDHVGRRRKVV